MKKGQDPSQAIEKMRKQGANKECADCSQKGTTYIVFNFHIFVCSNCAGIHRDIGHKVKGIGVSIFSDKDVKEIKAMGNEKAYSIWMGKFNPKKHKKPEPKDQAGLRVFIAQKYKDKKFYSNSNAKDSDDSDSEEEKTPKKQPRNFGSKKAETKPQKKQADDDFEFEFEDSQPEPKKAQPKKEEPKKEEAFDNIWNTEEQSAPAKEEPKKSNFDDIFGDSYGNQSGSTKTAGNQGNLASNPQVAALLGNPKVVSILSNPAMVNFLAHPNALDNINKALAQANAYQPNSMNGVFTPQNSGNMGGQPNNQFGGMMGNSQPVGQPTGQSFNSMPDMNQPAVNQTSSQPSNDLFKDLYNMGTKKQGQKTVQADPFNPFS